MTALTRTDAERRIASAPELYRGVYAGPSRDQVRFAVVRGARSVREAEAYLPGNYSLMESFEAFDGPSRAPRLIVIIGGCDDAGWTLEDYVIPRLASGLMGCEEIV